MSHTNAELHDLEQLYILYSKQLYRLACNRLYSKTGSTTDAADIVQSVFLLAGRRWDVLKNHSNPGGWLAKATNYLCSNYAQAYNRREEKDQRSIEQLIAQQPRAYGKLYTSAADDEFAAQDVLLTLEEVLSKEDYNILKSFCLDNLSVAEISHKTGISETALRVRIHRLRRYLEKYFVILVTFLMSQNI